MNGPYSSKNDLSLNNFIKAIKKVADDKPHLVIFCGPFVSYDNDIISKESEIISNENESESLTHHQIFEKILEKINETFSVKEISIVFHYKNNIIYLIDKIGHDYKCHNMSFFTRHN